MGCSCGLFNELLRQHTLSGHPHNAGDRRYWARLHEDIRRRSSSLWEPPAQTMTPHNDSALEVIRAAPDQAPILANLLELYAHDFSEFHDIDLGEDGRFGYRSLPLY